MLFWQSFYIKDYGVFGFVLGSLISGNCQLFLGSLNSLKRDYIGNDIVEHYRAY